MTITTVVLSKNEISVVIKFVWLKNCKSVQIHEMVCEVYSRTHVFGPKKCELAKMR